MTQDIMTIYKIFPCPRCETLLYCPQHQKSKFCSKCQKNIKIKRLKILKTTKSIQEAIFYVQNLKVPPEIRQQIANWQKKSHKIKSKKDLFLEFIYKIQKGALNKSIEENLFFIEARQAGFSENWILIQLAELEKNGLLFRPQKGYLQFLL